MKIHVLRTTKLFKALKLLKRISRVVRILFKRKRKHRPKKYNFVYETLIIGGTVRCYYIGKHSTDNMNDGYVGSGNAIHRFKQINDYYGYQVYRFKRTVLSHHKTSKAAYAAEAEAIRKYRLKYKNLLVNEK